MDAPEYLDLDEIDFTDDLPLSSKSIPELCRRHDGPSDDRQAPGVHWARSGSSLNSTAVKPTGIADVYSKFRPVKRVSPLKHQPEVSDSETQGKHEEPDATASKDDSAVVPTTIRNQKSKAMGNGGMFGELEHYDLDMDEILDVPYIKSSQQQVPQTSTLPRMKPSTLVHSESLNSAAQFCLLSPANWPDMRKSKSVDLRAQNAALEMDGDMIGPFTDSKLGADGKQMMFGTRGMRVREIDEESKKIQNILNIVREGQISLLVSYKRSSESFSSARCNLCVSVQPHLAVEHLECVRDEDGNNLLHISASRGHCECLQHLTTLMGEDFLNERNTHQLTPAGLAVRNGQLECVRWLVSDTEAIAELSCTREHPSLIHYAARHGQERVLLWLLQFMQEQGISLDEVDPDGSTAVHVAAQFGHLSCLQTLVEYGSNVTVLNLQGERPSQNAERQGHSACSRYLVVVESCMSLASQVVKLTKQLHQQTTARVALQNQLQLLLQTQESTGQPSSPRSVSRGYANHEHQTIHY
ncbi:hypothetical protein DNTS_004410 [Danionella cerebrum]|uniref:Synphilin-1 alpha-Synuclein-binding domain-containing protein n=1 Tax=Danionella cerebrum TaxID=2873325 RepID=A0A553NHD5_9TELE|nr:hypothetical protein DNTS_004410 [Danionella translucida]